MISRTEFYTCICILIGILIYSMDPWDDSRSEAEKAKIETRDSMIQVQKDSAFTRALKFELKADSLQAVINRKNLDLTIIHKKIENEKKNVISLNADSTLSLFQRSVTKN